MAWRFGRDYMQFFESFLPTLARLTSTVTSICLAFIAAYYTALAVGLPLAVLLVVMAVSHELIDQIVQTDPKVEGKSQLPQWIKDLHLQDHPVKSFFGAFLLIVLGVWQAGFRMYMFTRAFFLNQNMFFILPVNIFYGALFVGGSAAIANCATFIINFRKFWTNEVKGDRSGDSQKLNSKPVEPLVNGSRFGRFLDNNCWWFDKIVGITMLAGGVLYFMGDFMNFSHILAIAAASGNLGWLMNGAVSIVSRKVFGVPVAALLHGGYAYMNQMVLWGFNNKKFYVNHMNNGAIEEKSAKLPLIGLFHIGPDARRIVLYGRELILCIIDIFSACITIPTCGLALGMTSLVATMLCRWVVYYFQSRIDAIDPLVDDKKGKAVLPQSDNWKPSSFIQKPGPKAPYPAEEGGPNTIQRGPE